MITIYISKPQTLYRIVCFETSWPRRRDRSDRHRHRHRPYGHTVYPCTSSHVCTRRPRSRAHIPRGDAMYAKASPHRISTDHIAARRSRARSMMGVRCARVWNTQVGFPTAGDGVVARRHTSSVVRRHTSSTRNVCAPRTHPIAPRRTHLERTRRRRDGERGRRRSGG